MIDIGVVTVTVSLVFISSDENDSDDECTSSELADESYCRLTVVPVASFSCTPGAERQMFQLPVRKREKNRFCVQ